MDASVIGWPIVLAAAMMALGLYLHLGTQHSPPLLWVGVVLIALALGALISGEQAAWWPQSQLQSVLVSTIFIILACISLAGAAMTILSLDAKWSALGFLFMLLANVGLFLLAGAKFVAGAAILLYASVVVVAFLYVIQRADWRKLFSDARCSREPLLACMTGALLVAGLVGAIHVSLMTKPKNDVGQRITAALPTTNTIQGSIDNSPARLKVDLQKPHIAGFSKTLFNDHLVTIGLMGVVILAAVMIILLVIQHEASETTNSSQKDPRPETPLQTESQS